MLKVGQIRKDNTTSSYLTKCNILSGDNEITTKGYDSQTVFTDFGLKIEGNFQPKVTYYLRFTAKRMTQGDWSDEEKINPPRTGDCSQVDFSLILYQSNGGDKGEHADEKIQTIENILSIEPLIKYKEGQEGFQPYGKEKIFEIVFTPDAEYQYLSFQIIRNGYDYLYNQRDYFLGGLEEKFFLKGEKGDVSIVENILKTDGTRKTVDKIGIQSRPGTMFVINREPIRLGRSGVFEINNGMRISSVGIAAPNGDEEKNIPHFLLDYGVDTKIEEN